MADRSLRRTRGELSAFLQRHRRKLAPVDVGLPVTGRRRTPGLRREEVAALAGVGLTWYTWFEQGRDIGVSERFLLNVARALRLDDAECCHLFLLAHRRPPPPEAHHWPTVTPLVQQLMDDLVARPAYVINLRWDVVAWNAAADRLFGFAGRDPAERNFMRLLFADPALRRRLPAWHEDAPRLLSHFRCDLAVAPQDPAMWTLIDALKRLSADFRRWWDEAPQIEGYRRGIGTIVDPDALHLHFRHELLVVDEHRHLRMIVYFVEPEPA
ncbi:helix-turn-helix transcriptional regulator [Luteimonas suaedae]|uniref:helix-turn-helix transcriptional regulator n=1 Tax=Luteimonas suaedae TaxID=2605430 RepID=UPI0011EBBA7A|nr:helix-turn-helix transcriptional regulator [Luteimonas suaedae]